MSVITTVTDNVEGAMTRKKTKSNLEGVRSFEENDQQLREALRQRTQAKRKSAEKDVCSDSDMTEIVVPTSPTTVSSGDGAKSVAQQQWNMMFPGDMFELPESQFLLEVRNTIPTVEMSKIVCGIKEQLQRKKQTFPF